MTLRESCSDLQYGFANYWNITDGLTDGVFGLEALVGDTCVSAKPEQQEGASGELSRRASVAAEPGDELGVQVGAIVQLQIVMKTAEGGTSRTNDLKSQQWLEAQSKKLSHLSDGSM